MEHCVSIPGFHRLEGAASPFAVYCLLRQGRIVYVGKSTNVFARVGKHWQNMQRLRLGKPPYHRNDIACIPFDAVMVKFVPREALNREEIELIQRYQPQYNKALNRPAYTVDIRKIPAILEILKRGPSHQPAPFKKRRLGIAA